MGVPNKSAGAPAGGLWRRARWNEPVPTSWVWATTRITKTVIVRSIPLPRKTFRVFVELEGMYRNMVEQLAIYVARNNTSSFIRLRALKYREMRKLYPHLPSHYAYTACQDASARAESFLKLKEEGLAKSELPKVRRITIWLDDHLWKTKGYTSIEIANHRGKVPVEVEPHKQYWKYVNRGWRLSSEVKVKLDKKSRQLIIYLSFVKDVEEYKPRGHS